MVPSLASVEVPAVALADHPAPVAPSLEDMERVVAQALDSRLQVVMALIWQAAEWQVAHPAPMVAPRLKAAEAQVSPLLAAPSWVPIALAC